MGVPGGEARAWRSARRYFAGTTAADAVAVVKRLADAGLNASVDLFGEGADLEVARRAARDYEALCAVLAAEAPESTWVSIDLSHVAFDAGLLDAIAAAVPPGRRLQVVPRRPRRPIACSTWSSAPPPAVAPSRRRSRRTCRAPRPTPTGSPPPACPSAWSRAPTSSPERSRSARPPTPRTRPSPAACTRTARTSRWPPTTARSATGSSLHLPGARCELLLGVCPGDAVALAAAGRDTRIYVPYGPGWFRYLMRRRAEAAGA